MIKRSYSEMSTYSSFEERFNYLKLDGTVGDVTFGWDRYLNQALYTSDDWRAVRNKVILRDEGCDLGCPNRRLSGSVIIHHINPISREDILNRNPIIFDLDNLVTTCLNTHNAIHYGDINLLDKDIVIERTPFDTCPWKDRSTYDK